VAEWVADEFEESRPRLRGIAYRMLGSTAEADDAVQEAWLRLSRTGSESIDNLGGWLTTVVSRVCLDMLRSRRSRGEEPVGGALSAPVPAEDDPAPGAGDPEHAALVADSIGPALMLVLDSLDPDERLAFVLHDLFGVPFGEIAPIVGRSADATRQLASRARRRLRGAPPAGVASTSTKDLAHRDCYEPGRYFTSIVITGETIGGLNGTCDQSPSTSCSVCRPGESVSVVSVCPPPKCR